MEQDHKCPLALGRHEASTDVSEVVTLMIKMIRSVHSRAVLSGT